MTVRRMRPAWAALAFTGLTTVVAHAQVRVDTSGSVPFIVNELPVDVVVLTQSPHSKQLATTRVTAGQRGQAPHAAVLAVEPISVEVGRRAMFQTCGVAEPPSSTSLSDVVAELKAIDLLKTPSARERLEAASALAQLQLEQRIDEKATLRNDPLRAELRRQQEEVARQKTVQEILAERQAALQDALSDVTDLAMAWSSVQAEKLSILYQEVKTLKPFVDQSKLAYRIKAQELTVYADTVSAWQTYSATVARALDTAATSAGAADAAPIVVSTMRRVCGGPSLASDAIELEGPAGDRMAVVLAEVAFDKGGKQLTFLRRLSRTSRWTGRIDWPATATSARVKVRWPGAKTWTAAPSQLQSGRRAASMALNDAKQAVKQIEKKLKDGNFRAAGGDHIKTVPIF
jgi:hypothetical protein